MHEKYRIEMRKGFRVGVVIPALDEAAAIGRVINDQINTPLPKLAAARPDLPDALQEILDELCEKDPDDRPDSMDAVVDMLEGVRPQEIDAAPIAARAATAAAEPPDDPPGTRSRPDD